MFHRFHVTAYREKYALNLKRDFPRIPFYADFWRWAAWGKELMELDIGYETVEPWALERVDVGAYGHTPLLNQKYLVSFKKRVRHEKTVYYRTFDSVALYRYPCREGFGLVERRILLRP